MGKTTLKKDTGQRTLRIRLPLVVLTRELKQKKQNSLQYRFHLPRSSFPCYDTKQNRHGHESRAISPWQKRNKSQHKLWPKNDQTKIALFIPII